MNNKQRLLIVDDTTANIKILVDALRSEYAISAATNGEDALKIAASPNKPDLILLDIMMPEKDGFITCGELKKKPETSSVPIIILTSIESSSLVFPDAESAADSPHADEYIDKPVDPNFLLKRVDRLLKKSQP